MESGRRYSADLARRHRKKVLNFNEFTPIEGKTTGDEVIKEFLVQKDVAPWFRGTSHYHIKGSNKLFNALRDDGEQKTTHRVKTCLNLIGLKPMITPQQIKFLMHLSRGNDLVFLWFLMEKHYKTPKHDSNSFSLNEQLICSAICHLDMVTTLRELDKILPSGHSLRSPMKKTRLEHQESKESSKKQIKAATAQEHMLPYFLKCRPPAHYGKLLFLEEPNFKVDFKFYNHFNNPNYIVQNETNRWYADYHFDSGKRIVHLIIRELLTNMFNSFETICLKSRTNEILCHYHKTLKVMAAHFKHELKVKAKEECLKPYTSKENKQNENAKKIKKLLSNAVHRQLCTFDQETKSATKKDSLKIITSDCKVCDIILGGNGVCYCNVSTVCKTEMKNETNFASLSNCNENRVVQKCTKNPEPNKTRFRELSNSNTQPDACVDNDISASSDVLFQCPSMHKPFKFDYKKIFAPKLQSNEKNAAREIILAALNEDISCLSTDANDSRLSYDEAVKKCAKKTFDIEVEKYEAEKVMAAESKTAQSSGPISQYHPLANYNSESQHLMEKMLFDSFQHLRKNPKFVWAQLPDAHKVPFLREWIAHRFGKEYTPAEMVKSFRRSCLVFRALKKSQLKFSMPNTNRIGKNFFVDYSCRKHVEEKVQKIKRKHYDRLDSHFLEYTRGFWFAMRGYICSNGPPRKSFFAYMPSRLQDIQHFRLWKSSEYRNYWNAWNVRRQKKVAANISHF